MCGLVDERRHIIRANIGIPAIDHNTGQFMTQPELSRIGSDPVIRQIDGADANRHRLEFAGFVGRNRRRIKNIVLYIGNGYLH